MNWRLSQLAGVTVVSNSDAHSPSKLGRDVKVFLEAIIADVTAAGVASKA